MPGAVGGDHDGGGKVEDVEGDWKSARSFWYRFWVEKLSPEKVAESERRKTMHRDWDCVGGPAGCSRGKDPRSQACKWSMT